MSEDFRSNVEYDPYYYSIGHIKVTVGGVGFHKIELPSDGEGMFIPAVYDARRGIEAEIYLCKKQLKDIEIDGS